MVRIDVERAGRNAAVDDAGGVQGGKGGEYRHKHDARGLPGEIAVFRREEIVPQRLRTFHVFRNGVGRIVFFQNGIDGDKCREAAHTDQFAPHVKKAAQKGMVFIFTAGIDLQVI